MSKRLASIVLPVHNQADHVEAVLVDYVTHLTRLDISYELVVVVNNSTDASLDRCNAFAAGRPIKVIEEKQGGWGRAVKRGLRECEGEILCYTNSARTEGHELTLVLLYALNYPAVVVKANRKIREKFTRRLGSLIYNIECRALFDLSCWDVNGTPKVFPRTFGKLLELEEDGDLIDVEFDAVCFREKYPMIEVPIYSTRRHGGRSTTNYGSAFRMYVGAIRLYNRMKQQP